jgi:hypothetical protein
MSKGGGQVRVKLSSGEVRSTGVKYRSKGGIQSRYGSVNIDQMKSNAYETGSNSVQVRSCQQGSSTGQSVGVKRV